MSLPSPAPGPLKKSPFYSYAQGLQRQLAINSETAFPFLIRLFGEEKVKHKKVLAPHYSDFPVSYDGGPQSAWDTLHIIASQMEVDPDSITLDIYTDITRTLTTGSAMGGKFYLGDYDNTDTPRHRPRL